MATGLGIGVLVGESSLTWVDMARDASERLDTPLPPALLLASPLLVEVMLSLTCLITGLLAWHSARWFSGQQRTLAHQRQGGTGLAGQERRVAGAAVLRGRARLGLLPAQSEW
ncbi:hypothetical protein D3875_05945 [Deinococcus cavernae]|uniref:Uncharacterized protein n=1 Tax=Deinococcus cavernae TaxID=2320857 RepID=A0A418V4Z7_9DEIO|nr:hypothetical protein [Deinococcus cavernae]RJF71184.1 hypothetical protein D3875_05945 [Deinococcus cavernae]